MNSTEEDIEEGSSGSGDGSRISERISQTKEPWNVALVDASRNEVHVLPDNNSSVSVHSYNSNRLTYDGQQAVSANFTRFKTYKRKVTAFILKF